MWNYHRYYYLFNQLLKRVERFIITKKMWHFLEFLEAIVDDFDYLNF